MNGPLRRLSPATISLLPAIFVALVFSSAFAAEQPKPQADNAVKEIDGRALAAYGTAVELLYAEKYTEALQWFEKVLEYDPASASACIQAGLICEEKTNQPEKAQQFYEKALQIDPKNAVALFGHARILIRTGQEKQGVEELNKVIAAEDPKKKPILLANVYTQLAVLAEQKQQFDKAEENYQKAIALTPTPVYQLMRLAYLYRTTKDYDKSADVFKRVNRMIPGYARILFEISETYFQQEKWADSLDYLEKFLNHPYGPGEAPELLQRAADLAMKCGRHEVSIKYYERLLLKVSSEHKPETLPPQVCGELARALLQVNHADIAIPYFHRFIEALKGAEKIKAQFDLAVAYYLTKQHDSFLSLLKERAANATPELIAACKVDLAIGYERLDRIKEAEETLSSLADNPESRSLAFSHLGMLARRQEKYDAAVKHFTAAIESAKQEDSVNPRLQLSAALEEAGRDEEAKTVLVDALKLFPDNSSINNGLAWFYAQRGLELDQAKTLVEKALKQEPENSFYLDTLGWIFFKQGKHEAALEKLLKAESIDRRSSEILDHIGECYLILKNPLKAIEYFRRALEIEPKRKGLAEKIEKLLNLQIDK